MMPSRLLSFTEACGCCYSLRFAKVGVKGMKSWTGWCDFCRPCLSAPLARSGISPWVGAELLARVKIQDRFGGRLTQSRCLGEHGTPAGHCKAASFVSTCLAIFGWIIISRMLLGVSCSKYFRCTSLCSWSSCHVVSKAAAKCHFRRADVALPISQPTTSPVSSLLPFSLAPWPPSFYRSLAAFTSYLFSWLSVIPMALHRVNWSLTAILKAGASSDFSFLKPTLPQGSPVSHFLFLLSSRVVQCEGAHWLRGFCQRKSFSSLEEWACISRICIRQPPR